MIEVVPVVVVRVVVAGVVVMVLVGAVAVTVTVDNGYLDEQNDLAGG